jgi:hypothetical protein
LCFYDTEQQCACGLGLSDSVFDDISCSENVTCNVRVE